MERSIDRLESETIFYKNWGMRGEIDIFREFFHVFFELDQVFLLGGIMEVFWAISLK